MEGLCQVYFNKETERNDMIELKTLERLRIRADDEEMQKFFARLERETENLPGFHILFGKHILLLRFPDEETAEKYRGILDLVCTACEGKPDGTISVLQKDIKDYIDTGSRLDEYSCLEYTGETGLVRIVKWPERLLASHTPDNQQYIIMSGPLDGYIPYWAPFHWEFHNFAMCHHYAFVHGGAVGLNGEGVLITSMGGCGKSTTVLSCLLDGFDYISDDYLILEPETATAYPLYNCGILNEDSLNRLPELKPLVSGDVLRRENRYIVDLSGYRNQFFRGMKIKAIVHPRVLPADEPEKAALIRKDPLQTGKTEMLISSVRQNGFFMMRDQDTLHSLFGAVSSLPSYELILSPDRQSNCRALRELLGTLS